MKMMTAKVIYSQTVIVSYTEATKMKNTKTYKITETYSNGFIHSFVMSVPEDFDMISCMSVHIDEILTLKGVRNVSYTIEVI